MLYYCGLRAVQHSAELLNALLLWVMRSALRHNTELLNALLLCGMHEV
jgi:hypothetical protein